MRFSAALLWLALNQFSSTVVAEVPLAARQLRARDYNTRDYYALEISEITSPTEIANHFGLEYEGPLGQLRNHHLFSAPLGPKDVVDDRVQEYRRRRKRDVALDELYGSVLFAEKQKLKQLEKRTVPSHPSYGKAVLPDPQKGPDDMAIEELNKIKASLKITDPIFHKQWHLVCQNAFLLHLISRF